MKLTTSSNGNVSLKMSKSEWSNIGEKSGWLETVKADNNIVFSIIKELDELFALEESFKNTKDDILPLEEADGEDYASGYGYGMAANEYKASLEEPYVSLKNNGQGELNIKFYGNNSPQSVNAGRPKRIYINDIRFSDSCLI